MKKKTLIISTTIGILSVSVITSLNEFTKSEENNSHTYSGSGLGATILDYTRGIESTLNSYARDIYGNWYAVTSGHNVSIGSDYMELPDLNPEYPTKELGSVNVAYDNMYGNWSITKIHDTDPSNFLNSWIGNTNQRIEGWVKTPESIPENSNLYVYSRINYEAGHNPLLNLTKEFSNSNVNYRTTFASSENLRTYPGDSGSPVLFRNENGTWGLAGITSYAEGDGLFFTSLEALTEYWFIQTFYTW